uniref:Uncharacterized protein n=1 Tax=viral metagenome TaxID=1070528 RepID=A0A6C0F939_9ZZZZ|tara:strand:- start:16760 stop:17236 length:477 start_codon:yes stop_codon:yes gene_type:complete
MHIVIYNNNITKDRLQIGDKVLISLFYASAYCHTRKEFIGEKIEHSWGEILEIHPIADSIKITLMNCCNYSMRPEQSLKYKDCLQISKNNIKYHKTTYFETPSTLSSLQLKIKSLVQSYVQSLPESEKQIWDYMKDEEKLKYLDINNTLSSTSKFTFH